MLLLGLVEAGVQGGRVDGQPPGGQREVDLERGVGSRGGHLDVVAVARERRREGARRRTVAARHRGEQDIKPVTQVGVGGRRKGRGHATQVVLHHRADDRRGGVAVGDEPFHQRAGNRRATKVSRVQRQRRRARLAGQELHVVDVDIVAVGTDAVEADVDAAGGAGQLDLVVLPPGRSIVAVHGGAGVGPGGAVGRVLHLDAVGARRKAGVVIHPERHEPCSTAGDRVGGGLAKTCVVAGANVPGVEPHQVRCGIGRLPGGMVRGRGRGPDAATASAHGGGPASRQSGRRYPVEVLGPLRRRRRRRRGRNDGPHLVDLPPPVPAR